MNEKGTFDNELLMNQHNNRHTNKLNHIRRTNTLNRAERRQKQDDDSFPVFLAFLHRFENEKTILCCPLIAHYF